MLSNNRLDWTEEQTDSEDREDDDNYSDEQPEEVRHPVFLGFLFVLCS